MLSLLSRLSLAVLALSLTACVSFTNGVVDKPMANDERLIGYWEMADEKPIGTFTVTAAGASSLSIILQDEEMACHGFTALRTQIDNRDFLEISSTESGQDVLKRGPFTYQFQGADRLTATGPSLNTFSHAVTEKELPGKVTMIKDMVTAVDITASTGELRNWIATHPGAMGEKSVTFVRRDPASAPHCS